MKIDYNAMTDEEQIIAVCADGDSHVVGYINNPSEAVCMAAVMKNCLAIQHIQNSSEEIKLAAVTQNGWVIQHIKDPSEAVCMVAVNFSGSVIYHIKNPSEAIQLAAVKQNVWAVKNIHNPSEAVCMTAVKQNGMAIRYIDNPSEAVCITAVKMDPEALTLVSETISDTVAATQLIYHPLSSFTPKTILDRAPEILESHCTGLGDVYTIGLSIGMGGEEFSRTLQGWIVMKTQGNESDCGLNP